MENKINIYDSREDTLKHIYEVQCILDEFVDKLDERALNHDKTKLEPPEKEYFDVYTQKLKTTTYGSEEYKSYLKELKIALDHHYKYSPHHPEHHKNGIKDMTLIDLVEMIADWSAAVKRHDNGDINKSIEINQKRFGYSDELKQILINTVKYFDL